MDQLGFCGCISASSTLEEARMMAEEALAAGADLLIHESTFAHAEAEMAIARQHSTSTMAAQTALAGRGRVLLRPSGTEPVVRVMVEAETHERATEIAERLADVVRRTLG